MTNPTFKYFAFGLILLLFFIPQTMMAAPADTGSEFVREINESFPLAANGRLELANKYGQINIRTWEREQVKIDVRIVVQARNQEKADKVFDRIKISFSNTENLVKASTEMNSNRSRTSGWWDWITGNDNSVEFKIYYEVQMPNSASLHTEARYCDVRTPDLGGEAEFDIKYGDLNAGNINGQTKLSISYGDAYLDAVKGNADISVRYGEVSMDEARDVRLDARYSDASIERAGNVVLDARYTDVELGSVGDLEATGGYGDIEVESANSIRANSNYTNYDIGSVKMKVDIDTDYGDVEVGPVAAGFTDIRIRSTYSDVELELAANAGYNLSVRTSYAGISVPSSVNVSVREERGSSETVKGQKSGTGQGTIDISNSYGDVEISENR